MTNIRLLNSDEIECRVSQVTAKGCQILLYKTARVDRAILDEVYGDLWVNDFKVIDGKMYGGIGVWNKELNQWLWRWDCGVESNTEAEKGQASDAFKRSAFKFGIGVELYTAPFIWLSLPTVKNDKGRYELQDKYIRFEVKEISYDSNRRIKDLIIVDSKGNTVYSTKKQDNKKKLDGEVNEVKADTDKAKLLNRFATCLKYIDDNPEKIKAMLEPIAALAADLSLAGCEEEASRLNIILDNERNK